MPTGPHLLYKYEVKFLSPTTTTKKKKKRVPKFSSDSFEHVNRQAEFTEVCSSNGFLEVLFKMHQSEHNLDSDL